MSRGNRTAVRRAATAAVENLESRTLLSYTVSTLAGDASVGSLGWAVTQADAAGGAQVVDFAPSLTSGGSVMIFMRGTPIKLNDTSGTLTIKGPGANLLTLNGNGQSVVFDQPSAAAKAIIQGLTITGGMGSTAGGIHNVGSLEIDNSIIKGNVAGGGFGGGVNSTGSLTINSSTITSNTASSGAGVFASDLTMTNSTVTANTATSNGGGILLSSGTITDSTIWKNSASSGGGLFGSAVLQGTIVAGNTGGDIAGSAFNGSSYDLIGDGSGGFAGTSTGHNIVGKPAALVDPWLGPLADNGGPTPTLALLSGSLAIDAGSNFNSLTTDQRGSARPLGNAPDIGAFESSWAQAPQAPIIPAPLPSGPLPDLPNPIAPSSNPALPSGMDVFNPPVGSPFPANGAPTIAAYNLAAAPDDSLSITADKLTANTGSAAYQDTGFAIFGQTTSTNATQTQGQLQNASADGAIVTIPSSEPANSMYFVWPVNSVGYGTPVAVNQAQAWWLGPSAVAAGQTVSLYGRNLSNGAATPRSWIFIQRFGGQGQWATVTAVNPYKVDFTVPAGLSPGQYQVWVHNGHGGKYGWATPLTLTVQPTAAWTGAVINATSSFFDVNGNRRAGADNTAMVDSGATIQAELTAMTAGQTLFFPAGTYKISGQLLIPSNIRIVGASETGTILRFDTALSSGQAHVTIGTTNVEIDSIAFLDNTLTKYDASDGQAMLRQDSGSRFTMNQVYVQANNFNTVVLHNGQQITMQNTTLAGLQAIVVSSHDLKIDHTDFQQRYNAGGALELWNTHNISFTYCSTENYNETMGVPGWGQGRFVIQNGMFGTLYNEYMAFNTSYGMGALSLDNAGEQMGEEAPAVVLQTGTEVLGGGGLTSFTLKYSSISDFKNRVAQGLIYVRESVSIASGTGAGQAYTEITKIGAYNTANNTVTYTVSPGWTTAPNGSSQIQLRNDWRGTVPTWYVTNGSWPTLVIPGHPNIGPGLDVTIIGGKGLGQLRAITYASYNPATDSTTVSLDRPWAVAPNYTSQLEISASFVNNVFYQNTLQGRTDGYGSTNSGSVGFQPYVGSYGVVYDGNTTNNLVFGIALWSENVNNPTFYDDVINNHFNNSSHDGIAFFTSTTDPAPNFVGVAVRNNTVAGAAHTGIAVAESAQSPTATLSVVEHNTVTSTTTTHTLYGLQAMTDPEVLVYGNNFDAGTTGIAGIYFLGSPALLLSANTYANFIQDYAGVSSLGAIIESPLTTVLVSFLGNRVVSHQPTATSTSSTTGFTANSKASALSSAADSGVIIPSMGTGAGSLITRSVDPAADVYLSSATITGGSDIRKLTVELVAV